jgi:hypothetical protein
MPGLVHEEKESVKSKIVNIAKVIQQLQARIIEFEAQIVPNTSQEVHDQREESTKKKVVIIRSITS